MATHGSHLPTWGSDASLEGTLSRWRAKTLANSEPAWASSPGLPSALQPGACLSLRGPSLTVALAGAGGSRGQGSCPVARGVGSGFLTCVDIAWLCPCQSCLGCRCLGTTGHGEKEGPQRGAIWSPQCFPKKFQTERVVAVRGGVHRSGPPLWSYKDWSTPRLPGSPGRRCLGLGPLAAWSLRAGSGQRFSRPHSAQAGSPRRAATPS